MNVIVRPSPPHTALAVAHMITAYDVLTDGLVQEFEIPPFLEGLALKIAEVPVDDPEGALAYRLQDSQVEAFRFILGLRKPQGKVEYFFESFCPPSAHPSPRMARGLVNFIQEVCVDAAVLAARQRISERDLTIPTLRLLEAAAGGFLTTGDLKRELTRRLQPAGHDAELLAGRSDSHFAQKVRNMISNRRAERSFINRGYAQYLPDAHGLCLTDRGREVLRDLDRFGRAKRH